MACSHNHCLQAERISQVRDKIWKLIMGSIPMDHRVAAAAPFHIANESKENAEFGAQAW